MFEISKPTDNSDHIYLDIYETLYAKQKGNFNNDKDYDQYQKDLLDLEITPEESITIEGTSGDDHYYIDNGTFKLKYGKDPGNDTVHSSISYTLPSGIDNLMLTNWNDPVKVNLDNFGTCQVYGHPTNVLLDYYQGNESTAWSIDFEEYKLRGTCAWVSFANILKMQNYIKNKEFDMTTEKGILEYAKANYLISNMIQSARNEALKKGIKDNAIHDYVELNIGDLNPFLYTNLDLLENIFTKNGVPVDFLDENKLPTLDDFAQLLKEGKGVSLRVVAERLVEKEADRDYSVKDCNHRITLTGAVYDITGKNLIGFYAANSGLPNPSPKLYSIKELELAYLPEHVKGSNVIITKNPLDKKHWSNNINGMGNELDNEITGNDANNILAGDNEDSNNIIDGQINDKILGGAGDDTLYSGGFNLQLFAKNNIETNQLEFRDWYVHDEKNSGNDLLDGGAGNDEIYGGDGNDTLIGGAGFDTLDGGTGFDTYKFSSLDQIMPTQNSWYIDENGTMHAIVEFAKETDWIMDEGGEGEIVVDYQTLKGGKSIGGNEYRNDDIPGVLYIWDGNTNGPNDLTIELFNTTIIVRNFNNTDLGITLSKEESGSGGGVGPASQDTRETETQGTNKEPLVFDLNNDGELSVTSSESGIYFDYKQDGFLEKTPWAAEGDGVLIADLNHNGTVDGETELLSINQVAWNQQGLVNNAYKTLKGYDTNSDGVINANDAIFADLKIMTIDSQLHSLDEYDIASINLTSTLSQHDGMDDAYGNTLFHYSTYTKTDGTTGKTGSYFFNVNTYDTIQTEYIEVPEDIAALPDFDGYGNVLSLHDAMAKDTTGEIRALVEAFMLEPDVAAREAIVDQLLLKWTNSENMPPNERAYTYDVNKFNVIESFGGAEINYTWAQCTIMNTHEELFEKVYDMIKNQVYTKLNHQTHMKWLFDMVTVTFDETRGVDIYDFSDISTEIITQINANQATGDALFDEFTRICHYMHYTDVHGFEDFYNTFESFDPTYTFKIDTINKEVTIGTSGNDVWYTKDLTDFNDYVDAGAGDDIITPGRGADVVYGGAGDDYIHGFEGNDTLYGGEGNDEINGYVGDDTIIGGTGNDYLMSNSYYEEVPQGSDTYIYNRGDGFDIIDDYDIAYKDSTDTLKFTDGILREDISFTASGNDLIITVDNVATQGVKILNYFETLNTNLGKVGRYGKIEIIELGDGTIVSEEEILSNLVTTGSGVINGSYHDEQIIGSNSNDTIYAKDGDDTITANQGNDTISGYDATSYIFNAGDGHDTIIHDSSNRNGQIEFGTGITASDLNIFKDGNNLQIDFVSSSDAITIKDYFTFDNRKVSKLVFSDNSETLLADLFPRTQINGTSGDDYIDADFDYSAGVNLYGLEGDDIILGTKGDDYIDGGAGADTMYGTDMRYTSYGNDVFVVDDPDDVVIDNKGTDEIRTYIDYTLPETIENLTLIGSLDISGTGNNLDNILVGNDANNTLMGEEGNDTLIGNLGVDTLYGDIGDDTYVYDGEDTIVELTSQGIDTVQSEYTYTLTDHVENIELLGTNNIDGIGNELHNVITGNTGNNILDGKAGIDKLTGGLGDDTYIVDNYSDIVIENANEGTDLVKSNVTYSLGSNLENLELTGTANSNAFGNNYNNEITGNTGDNSIYASGGNDTVYAGEGNDDIMGGLGDDIINGEAGNDLLDGEEGADTLIGGSGDDTYYYDIADTLIENVDEGSDTIISDIDYTLPDNFENIFLTGIEDINATGNNSDNTIIGNDGNNVITTYEGNDIIDGGLGIDTMVGGLGDDTYTVDNTSDIVTENIDEGIDRVISSISYTLSDNLENLELTGYEDIDATGNNSNNEITGNAGINIINSLAGEDIINAGEGDDIINSGDDNDIIYGDAGVDEIHAGLGDDVVSGGSEIDTIYGEEGNDSLYGDDGDDIIEGDEGNDIIDGGTGIDAMSGGVGDDIYFVDNELDVVNELIDEGTDTIATSMSYTIGNNVENLELLDVENYSLSYDDVDYDPTYNDLNGTGNTLNNILTGNTGSNILYGLEGNDTLTGNYGDDTLIGGIGDDTVQGDDGDDTYTFNLGDGQDTIINNDSSIFASDVIKFGAGINSSNITLTQSGNDVLITINSTTDQITVKDYFINDAAKVDKIVFDDLSEIVLTDIFPMPTVSGDTSDNTLTAPLEFEGYRFLGYEGNDTLTGNKGNDILDGGTGADTMSGGEGSDTYIVDNTSDVVIEEEFAGSDTIQSSVSYTIANNVEELQLTGTANIDATGNDGFNTLTGNDGNNILHGGAGFDILSGGLGDDTIYGEDDADFIDGGEGTDTLYGGIGDDYYIINDVNDTIIENTDEGTDSVTASVSFALNDNLENLELTGDSDINANGNDLDNEITGNAGDNIINAFGGNDSLSGNEGDDIINAGDGYDYIQGGTGNDTLSGGAGNDMYIFNLGDGQDIIQNNDVSIYSSDTIFFGEGIASADLTYTQSNNDLVITINETTDQITISDFFLRDSAKVDTLSFVGDDDVLLKELYLSTEIDGTTGNDTIDSSAVFVGSIINGLEGNDVILGSQGNDVIDGGSGIDQMTGNTGDDIFTVDDTNDIVIENMDEGIDLINTSVDYTLSDNVEYMIATGVNNLTLIGNTLDNYITGNEGHCTISGLEGDDTIVGQAGNDLLLGGIGNDYIQGEAGDDSVQGDAGIDVIYGGEGNDVLEGGIDDDSLYGDEGDDTIYGDDGNDQIDGGSGIDHLIGGFGDDVYTVDNINDVIVENENEGIDEVVSYGSYTLADNIENLTMNGVEETEGIGNSLDNVIKGSYGNDVIYGQAGDDTLYGNSGDDVIYGGDGNDTIESGIGNDTIYDSSGSTYIFNLGDGSDTIIHTDQIGDESKILFGEGIEQANLTIQQVDNNLEIAINETEDKITLVDYFVSNTNKVDKLVFADSSEIILAGLVSGNVLQGTDNDDTLDATTVSITEDVIVYGLLGNDTISGGDHNDMLYSNAGNDVINGGLGNDILNGGDGVDQLTGGLGDDSYYVDNANDVVTELSGEGFDTVVSKIDYTINANVEKLVLTGNENINAYGDSVDNIITGNNSNNEIQGYAGNDTLSGNSGHDIIYGGLGDDLLYGNSGNDLLDGGEGSNQLYGGSGHDTLIVNSGTNQLYGGTGDDTYVVNNTTETIVELANEGFDTVASSVDFTILANIEKIQLIGNDALNAYGNELNNTLAGNNGDNDLFGYAGNDILYGGDGNDTLDGGYGDDQVIGGIGNDTYYISSPNDTVIELSNEGTDFIISSIDYTLGDNIENISLIGTDNINVIGNNSDNTILGNFGNNELHGMGGVNQLSGSRGDDTYFVNNANDNVTENENEGFDRIYTTVDYTISSNVEELVLASSTDIKAYGNNSDNRLVGSTGNNELYGYAGDDIISAGYGNDLLDGGTGVNTLYGNYGDDTYIVLTESDSVIELGADQGLDTVQSYITYTLNDYVENLTLVGNADINAHGNDLNNVIIGNSGNNELSGGVGDDTLVGSNSDTYLFNLGDGNDTINHTAVIGEVSKIRLGNGITFANLSFAQEQDNLIIGIDTTTDSITIVNFFTSEEYQVDKLAFSDNSEITLASLFGESFMEGTSNDDVLDGRTNLIDSIAYGYEGNDTIYGSIHNDLLDGGANNDIIEGNAGNDQLEGGTGIDQLYGQSGDDTYYVDDINDTVIELIDEGNDNVISTVEYTLSNHVENLTLLGTDPINASGNDLDNIITGNSGNNELNGLAGADQMIGGAGNDTYYVDNENDTVIELLYKGTDSIISSVNYTIGDNIEKITLTGSNDINANGNTLNNTIIGNSGSNELFGNAGSNVIYGEAGNDILIAGSASWSNSLYGGDGDDVIYCSGSGSDHLEGNAGNDTLYGYNQDYMYGGIDNDIYIFDATYIDSYTTNQTSELENEGIDTVIITCESITQSDPNYTLGANIENLTFEGSRTIHANANDLDNIIVGNSGYNWLSAHGGNDTVYGGAGNDTLHGGLGSDILIGGTGNDTYYIDEVINDTIIENANEGSDTVLTSIGYTLADNSNIENITLYGTESINASGNDFNNTLTGNDASNELYGFDGSDTLNGGLGDDLLDGGTGADTMNGGAGNDIYIVDNVYDVTSETSSLNSIDIVHAYKSHTLGNYIENIILMGEDSISAYGNVWNNEITGNSAANYIYGFSGNNTINAENGDDIIYGGSGNDSINSGSGNDIIYGEAGNDIIDGDDGNDIISGGLGNDIITGTDATTYLFNSGDGQDTITHTAVAGQESKITFGANIKLSNLTFTQVSNNLEISISTTDKITIVDYYSSDENKIDKISFVDNREYLIEELFANYPIIEGTAGNDILDSSLSPTEVIIKGYEGYDAITGSNYDDTLYGGDNDDNISGGIGNDTLISGKGNDTLSGGEGNDLYILGDPDNVSIAIPNIIVIESTNEGIDTVITYDHLYTLGDNVENLTLAENYYSSTGNGNELDNIITGDSINNTLYGLAGNDTLYGNAGGDTIYGGNDNDILYGGTGGDTLKGESGDDQLYGGEGADSLDGGTGVNVLNGGLGSDTYYVNSINDIVIETFYENTTYAVDQVISSIDYTLPDNIERLDLLTGSTNINGSGNILHNTIYGNNGHNELNGYDGNDTIYARFGDDVINGGSGNDSLYGEEGNDIINGGSGDDVINAGDGNDILNGNAGNDNILGGTGDDNITDSEGNNTLYGDAGNDTILGGSGNDIIDGGIGYDSMIGGLGDDTYSIDSLNDVITELANEGTDTVRTTLTYTLDENFENILLLNSTEDINAYGNNLNNTLSGNSLNNELYGYAGNDTLSGGNGNDILNGGEGADTLDGGSGNDTYYIDNINDTITDSSGNDTIITSMNYNLPSYNIENITLTGNENLASTGNSLNNIIIGNSGNNTLRGESGNDTLYGNDGNDTLYSGSGDDTLYGGEGNDFLSADSGNNRLVGSGSDTYYIYTNSYNNTIEHTQSTADESIITFGVNYNAIDLRSLRINNDLKITIRNTTGSITIKDYFVSDSHKVDKIVLTGDVEVKISDLAGGQLIYGSENNETIDLSASTNAVNIFGYAGDDILIGSIYDDTLNGGEGTDILIGGIGNDTYVITDQFDIITENTDEGNDTAVSSISYTLGTNLENITLTGNNNLTATGNTSDNILTGNDGNNQLFGLVGDDTLQGGSGDDVLDGGEGIDTLIGGIGNDTYLLNDLNDTITENTNEGMDTIITNVSYTLLENFENLTLTGTEDLIGTGNTDDNILIGNAGNNELYGLEGNDTLNGGTGTDTLIGGVGNDTYVIDNENDIITELANEGTDTIMTSVEYNIGDNIENITLIGNASLNAIGNDFDNIIIGNIGDNTFRGNGGNDYLMGGNGDDIYYIDDLSDIIIENANEGTDAVISSIAYTLDDNVEMLSLQGYDDLIGYGNELNNSLYSNYGNTELYGYAGDDYLSGGSGDNLLDGGTGADHMNGRIGDDTYIVDNIGDTINETDGTDTVISSIDYTLPSSIEILELSGTANLTGIGNENNNIITGNSANNELSGLAGNDIITGNGGNDTVTGGEGNDTISASGSASYLFNTGDGIDSITHTAITGEESKIIFGETIEQSHLVAQQVDDNLEITINNSADQIIIINYFASDTNKIDTIVFDDDTEITVESLIVNNELYGTPGDDILDGTVLTDDSKIYGLEGNDILYGSAFNDELYGGADNDELYGYSGNDLLEGNAGNDILNGGLGVDQLLGGLGNDTYIIDSAEDTIVELTDEGIDTVIASLSYTIDNNIENVTLSGASDINITGNSLTNVLTGNSGNNVIDGGAGADTMIGSTGNDTYYIDDVNDVVYELADEGIDTVISSLSYTTGGNIENATLSGTSDLNLFGNELDNIFTGNTGVNIIVGSSGDDTIYGGDGDDDLTGSIGNDTIYGDAGDDELYGEDGNNILFGGAGSDSLYTWDGADELHGGDGDDLLSSDAGDDILYGDTGNDSLFAYTGNDILDGGTGADSLYGSTGNDIYYIDDLNDVVYELTDEGIDTVISSLSYTAGGNIENATLSGTSDLNLYGNELDNTLIGNTGVNVIVGSSGNDVIYGGDGNDNLTGSIGNDTLYGDAGNDELYGEDGNNVLYGGTGNDSLYTWNGADELHGGDGDDLLSSAEGNDILYGDAGDDYLSGWIGNDILDGGIGADILNGSSGNDIYYVDNVNDVIYETEEAGSLDKVFSSVTYTAPWEVEELELTGTANINANGNYINETIRGNSGNNVLTGGGGNDILYGNDGNDTLNTWTGNDILNGGAGADIMTACTGNDTYYVDNINDIIYETEEAGSSDKVFSSVTYTAPWEVEELELTGTANIDATGNYINETITGNSGNNILTGGGGNDILYGNDGDDSLNTWTGNDILNGGAGADIMTGSTGNDIYYVDNVNDVIYESEEAGSSDKVFSSVTYTAPWEVEELELTGTANINANGNYINETITGNSGDNVLTGGGGNDILYGNGGDDSLNTWNGNDILNGGAGADVLTSCDGQDTLNGGTGSDTMYGCAGNDIYEFNLGDGIDTIIDYDTTTGNLDTLELQSTVSLEDVAIWQDGTNLMVDYGTSTNSDVITVQYQTSSDCKIEKIELNDGSYLTDSDINLLIQDLTAFASNNSISLSSVQDVKNNEDLMNIVMNAWQS